MNNCNTKIVTQALQHRTAAEHQRHRESETLRLCERERRDVII